MKTERLDPFQYYYEAERAERLAHWRASMSAAEKVVRELPPGWEGTVIDIAKHVSGIIDPSLKPGWTTLVLRLIRLNVIADTALRKIFHGSRGPRLIPVYRRLEDA